MIDRGSRRKQIQEMLTENNRDMPDALVAAENLEIKDRTEILKICRFLYKNLHSKRSSYTSYTNN